MSSEFDSFFRTRKKKSNFSDYRAHKCRDELTVEGHNSLKLGKIKKHTVFNETIHIHVLCECDCWNFKFKYKK